MALGRGLASLIPGRRYDDEDEDLQEDDAQLESAVEISDEPESSKEENAFSIPVAEESDEDVDISLPAFDTDEDETVSVPAFDDTEDEDVVIETPTEQPSTGEAFAEAVKEAPVEATFEDFSQLEGDSDFVMPSKPNVTPLELDPQEDHDLFKVADEAAARIKAESTTSQEVVQQDEAILEAVEDEPSADDVSEPEEVEVPQEPVAEEPVTQKEAVAAASNASTDGKWDKHEDNVQHVAIGDIEINPLQPRKHFAEQELDDLKASIDQHGILQPLVVRRLESGKYELIAGERRLRASKALGWTKVPAVVRRDVQGNESRMVYALIENIQRQDLDPIELAYAYQRLAEDYGMSHEEIGMRVGKSRVSVTNALRVMQLPAEIQQGLSDGTISPGHARAILMIPDEAKQVRFYKHLVDEGLTVRKAETRARRIQRQMKVHDPMRNKDRKRHPLANKYAPALEERWGTNVNVKFNEEKNRFEVIFKAYNMGDFEQLVGRLLGTEQMLDTSQDDDVLSA